MECYYKAVPVRLEYDEYDPPVQSDEPPIIFMHGLFMNRKTLAHVAQRMCKRSGRKTYVLDLRAHGESPSKPELNIFNFAADVKHFIENQKLKKVVLMCNSFSARIAAILANDPEELVEKMIFVDISPYSHDGERVEKGVKVLKSANDFLKTSKTMDFESILNILKSFIPKNLNKDKMMGILRQSMTEDEEGVRFNCDWDNLWKAFCNGELGLGPLDIYTGPVLFLSGDDTKSFLRDDNDPLLQKYFPNVKKMVMEGGTHMLMMEKPEEFVEIALKFLSE